MNTRQQNYKKNRIIGMNPENAALAAGYSKSYARAKAYRIEMSAKVGIQDAFEQAGLTDKAIVAYALEGMHALKIQSCNLYVQKNKDGKWEIQKNENDFIEVFDWNARHKFFNTAIELMGKKLTKVEHSGNITFTKMGVVSIPVAGKPGVNRVLEFDIG